MSDGAGQAQGSGPDLSVHFKNTYKPSPHPPPDNLHEHTPAKDYEHNFAFGVKVIKSDRVLLLPLTVGRPAAGCQSTSEADEMT